MFKHCTMNQVIFAYRFRIKNDIAFTVHELVEGIPKEPLVSTHDK